MNRIRVEEISRKVESICLMVREKRKAMFEKLRLLVSSFKEEDAKLLFGYLLEDNNILKEVEELRDLLPQQKEGRDITTYMTGSWYLYECFNFLRQGTDEDIHYVTGVQIEDILTLDRLIPFYLAQKSAVYVKGDLVSSTACLIRMEELGHRLHAWFHIHPGESSDSIHPSSIDINQQKMLERGGYPVIGGIFSRDGFVRFFSIEREFEISVYGKGVEKIGEKLYRLTKIREVHHKRNIARRLTRGRCHR